MSDLFERDERVTRVDNNLDALKAIVKDRIAIEHSHYTLPNGFQIVTGYARA